MPPRSPNRTPRETVPPARIAATWLLAAALAFAPLGTVTSQPQ